MNQINQGGKSIHQYDDHIVIDGKTYIFPDKIKNSNKKHLVIKDGEIIINGYLFNVQDGSFTKKIITSPATLVNKLFYSFINILKKKRCKIT